MKTAEKLWLIQVFTKMYAQVDSKKENTGE